MEHLLQPILKTYGEASSYEDAGLVSFNQRAFKFRTSLLRPENFLFECEILDSSGKGKDHCAIGMIDGEVHFYRTKWMPMPNLDAAFYSGAAITFGHSLFISDLLFHLGHWSLAKKDFTIDRKVDGYSHFSSIDQKGNSEELLLDERLGIFIQRSVKYNFSIFSPERIQAVTSPVLGIDNASLLKDRMAAGESVPFEASTTFEFAFLNRISTVEQFRLRNADFLRSLGF